MRNPFCLFTAFSLFICFCTPPSRQVERLSAPTLNWKYVSLPDTPTMVAGNPDAGLNYLLYGDMLSCGTPLDMLGKHLSTKPYPYLERTGINRAINHGYTAFETAWGVQVLNGNCFSCHASFLNGDLVLGLGNTEPTYQKSIKVAAWGMRRLANKKYPEGSAERTAFGNFGDYYWGAAPYIQTNNPGLTPAFRLEEACVRHRRPMDLLFEKEPRFEMIRYTLASDVPPLWNLDKKSAIYYNGMGRGDLRKLLLQAVVLATPDSSSAQATLVHMDDIVAWAQNLQPPPYPFDIDKELAEAGRLVFLDNCERCHGKYRPDVETYPNLLVSLNEVGTDPYYALYLAQLSKLPSWYNESWLAQSEPESSLEPAYGYVAPPLDGIWATAPYLHNGSVPTLMDLLNSPQRPVLWQRLGDSRSYDTHKVGWMYKSTQFRFSKKTYNTRLAGSHNQGHQYGDRLSSQERAALLEYLKTL